MFDVLTATFESAVGWLMAEAVVPALYALGLMSWVEWAHEATAFVLAGLLQILAIMAVCWPLERWRPVEAIRAPREVRTDVIYSLVAKLGLMPLLTFAALWGLLVPLEREIRMAGYTPWSLEDLIPALAAWPGLSLVVYILILDFGEYWRHRLQHRWDWWWQLHALHHSQQQMTFWSDDRNHLLDDLLAAIWTAMIALAIGVPPQQFPLVLFATKLLESLSHANVRLDFGPLRHVFVSPRFHRTHHGIEIGHTGPTQGVNFAVVFSFWDKLFGTADHRRLYPATGIQDQAPAHGGVHYGSGYWETQWLGFVRFFRALRLRRPARASASP